MANQLQFIERFSMSEYDLIFVHAPSVYDFREHSSLFGPVSDVIPSTPVFEMYPIGFTTIASKLSTNGYRVRILNLAAHMLANDSYDVEKAISKLRSKVFGIDLHWLPHAHGSLEVAKLIKKIHPDSKVILGGFSATYFWEEIMRDHPSVDAVFLGDSTELPMLRYFQVLEKGKYLDKVPNLVYRDGNKIRNNGITHFIENLDDVEVDYKFVIKSVIKSMDLTGHLPYIDWKNNPMFLVNTVRGCALECATCMGGCNSFKRNFGRKRPAYRSPEKLMEDINQIESYFKGVAFVFGDIRQPGKNYARQLLSLIKKERPNNELAFEFFTPPNKEFVRTFGKSLEEFNAQISPDSHDPVVREAQGRYYSNEAMEKSISYLLQAGVKRMDIFFMIGLPKQDRKSVMDTVEYSKKLLSRMDVAGRLLPFISPLAPFVDPGSNAFEEPEKYGYRLLAKNLKEHRQLLTNPSWKLILNYETNWMTRDEIMDATYAAGIGMNKAKKSVGAISLEEAKAVHTRIKLAREAVRGIDIAMKSSDPDAALAELSEELKPLSESTVCNKRELDWARRSFYWSIPKIASSILLRK